MKLLIENERIEGEKPVGFFLFIFWDIFLFIYIYIY